MAGRLATRGEGGRTRGSEQEKPGRPSGWPHGAQANAGSPGNSHLGGVFKHAGCEGRSWQLSGCSCGHSGGSQDEHPARQGHPHPRPAGPGSRWRGFPKTRSRCEAAAGGVLGAPFARRPLPRTRAGSGVGGEAVSLRRAGLRRCHALGSSSQRALWESEVVGWTAGPGRRRPGWPEGPGHLPMGRTPPGLRCPLPGASAGVCGSAARGRAPRRRSLESQPENRSSSGLRGTGAPRLSLGARQAGPSALGVPRQFGAVAKPASGLSFGPRKAREGPWGPPEPSGAGAVAPSRDNAGS